MSETKQLRATVRVLRILRGKLGRLRFDLKDQLAMFPAAGRGAPTGCLDGHPNLPRWGPRKPAINGMSFGGRFCKWPKIDGFSWGGKKELLIRAP